MRIQSDFDCEFCNQQSDACHALAHFTTEIPPGEDGKVFIAIPLGKGQFDLAMDRAIVRRVKSHHTDLSHLRLLSSDPLFAAEYGRSYPETAFYALSEMISKYNMAAGSVYMSNDQRGINWFEAQMNRFNALQAHFHKRISQC
ncbi:hypothetical protein N7475_003556 [Penicillium sp. IBT 31633x]|nr:hypothetical protein N7475_003556 [Penicillium sp. IBT 31633x]